MSVIMLMGVGVAATRGAIGMNMLMLVVMSCAIRIWVIMSLIMLMGVGVAVTGAAGMNMLMLVVMNCAMRMAAGMAVNDAIGVNMVMPAMVRGVGLYIKHGRPRLTSTSTMPAN